jgi:hypothetical protein
VGGAIGFVVGLGGGLLVEVVEVFNCAGADAQEGKEQEDGGEATQGKQEYAAMVAGVSRSITFHLARKITPRALAEAIGLPRCWWAMLVTSAGSFARS